MQDLFGNWPGKPVGAPVSEPAQEKAQQYHYSEVLPIESFTSTVWMVEFEGGKKELHIWHKAAKIEDIVHAINNYKPGSKFTVSAVDVGIVTIGEIGQLYSNGRKLNQDMIVAI